MSSMTTPRRARHRLRRRAGARPVARWRRGCL